MSLVVLQLQKTLTTEHALVYGMGAGGGAGVTTAENIDHCPYSGVWSGVAGYGTGSTTTAENIDHCPHSGVWSGVVGYGAGSTTTAENIDHCPYSGGVGWQVMGTVGLQLPQKTAILGTSHIIRKVLQCEA